ncbi:hypothetical protein ATO4_04225 [Aurantimonas sp. 22II-16-19i]|nr:hypothetical protein ATO4_04225 [Aurantimonas sp. 22II-16-19i]
MVLDREDLATNSAGVRQPSMSGREDEHKSAGVRQPQPTQSPSEDSGSQSGSNKPSESGDKKDD